MKVKIGNTIADSNEQPIMLIFDSLEQRKLTVHNLTMMENNARKYVEFNNRIYSEDSVRQFMKSR